MNDLSQILLTIILNTGLMSIITFISYRKQNRKLKDKEVELESEKVEKARIESKSDEWHLYKEQLELANNRIKELLEVNREKESRLTEKERLHSERISEIEERFTKQTNFLRGVQRNLNESLERENALTCKIGKLTRLIDYLKQWLCKKPWSECKVREPEQVVKPLKYIPFEEITEVSETLITELGGYN